MRNAVIRKKRLKVERIVDDYMRMPQRIIVPTFNFKDEREMTTEDWRKITNNRVWEL